MSSVLPLVRRVISLAPRLSVGLAGGIRGREFSTRLFSTLDDHGTSRPFADLAVSEEDKFRFDLEGFVVVKNVFTDDEVAAANSAIDRHAVEMKERQGVLRNTHKGAPLAGYGDVGRRDLGGMLGWPAGDRDIFRRVLAHPRLVPYYHEFIGHGYRLDHLPLVIEQRLGAEGFDLHGGPLDDAGHPNFFLTYQVAQTSIRTSLLAAAVQLTDVPAGDGGFCILKGSHKAAFKVPRSVGRGDVPDLLYQLSTKAGDVVLFSEATTHGSLPWKNASFDRRVALFRFAPSNFAYGRSYFPSWPAAMLEGCSDVERAVMEPPYNNRLDRPFLKASEQGSLEVVKLSRSEPKKNFDKAVFKSPYF